MHVCTPECIYVDHVCQRRPEEGVRPTGTEVTGGWSQCHGLWELNPDPLKEPLQSS